MAERLSPVDRLFPMLPTHTTLKGGRCKGSNDSPGKIVPENGGPVGYCSYFSLCNTKYILVTIFGSHNDGQRYWSRTNREEG